MALKNLGEVDKKVTGVGLVGEKGSLWKKYKRNGESIGINREVDMPKIALMYDTDLKRPGCVLLQAINGCDSSSPEFQLFDSSDWLVSPTEGLKKLEGDHELWIKVAQITINNRNK